MAELRFNLRPNIIQGADLDNIYSANDTIYIEYNNYYPAGTLVSKYRIEAKLDLANVTVHDDLSVSFDYGGVQAVRACTTHSSGATGYNVNKTLFKADNSVAWQQSSDIATSFDTGWISVATQARQHYTVPANSSITIPEIKAFRWLLVAVVSDECEVYVGGTVTNIIPTYKPNGLRKSNNWQSVQSLSQSTYLRKNGNWKDVGTENVDSIGHVNTGNTRRRQGNQWKQEAPFN